MAVIRVSRTYTMPREEVNELLREAARRLNEAFKLEHDWQEDRIDFYRRGVEGRILVSGCEIDIEVKLGLMTSVIAKPLRQEIERYMDELVS